jgi:hypothetical protein
MGHVLVSGYTCMYFIYMYVSTDSNITYTNCKSTWFCINTFLRIVQGTKGICRSQGKEHNSQTKTDKTTRGKQCRESDIIKEVSCDLTVVWFIFRNCYTLCPLCKKKKSWRKEEKLNYIQVKWRERQRYRSRSFCILMRNTGQKCRRSLCFSFF